jgi:hypothetical protein
MNDKGHRMRYRRAFAEVDEKQATIDALVAALDVIVARYDAGYFDSETAEGAAAMENGRTALAQARGGK